MIREHDRVQQLETQVERLKSLARYNPNGVIAIDLCGRISECNQAFLDLTGYSVDEVIGCRFMQLLTVESIIQLKQHMVSPTSVLKNTPLSIVRRDGQPLQTLCSTIPVIVENRNTGFYAVVADVHERLNEVEKLKAKTDMLVRAQQIAQLGYWVLDIPTGQLTWSEDMFRIYQIHPEDFHHTHADFLSRVYAEDKAYVKQQTEQAFMTGRYDLECRIVLPDGNLRYVQAVGHCEIDKLGKPIRLFGITQDVTDRKLLEQTVRLSAIGELAAGVAHEIRNPLTALKGFTQLFQDQASEDQQKHYQVMLAELDRIELILNEFLVLAKPHAVHYKVLKIGQLMNDVVTLISSEAHLHNVILQLNQDFCDEHVRGEPHRLKQVFLNIIKNAIEAMQEGGNLDIDFEKTDKTIIIQITDTGQGIPPEYLQRLGEPFLTTKPGGTGLGLTVSQKILADHGGNMTIHSREGFGTTVTVTLLRADEEAR